MTKTNVIIFSVIGFTVVVVGGIIIYHYVKPKSVNNSIQDKTTIPISWATLSPTSGLPLTTPPIKEIKASGKFKVGDCIMANGKVKVGLCGKSVCSDRDSDEFTDGQIIGRYMYETDDFIFYDGGKTIYSKPNDNSFNSVYTTKVDAKIIKAPIDRC